MALFGKGGKRGAPAGNKNAAGRHNKTGMTDGRILGTALGAHVGGALVHGGIRGLRGAKSRAGYAALGGAASVGAGTYLMGSVMGGEDFGKLAGVAGTVGGAALSGGLHKAGHSLGKASYENSIRTGKAKRGIK